MTVSESDSLNTNTLRTSHQHNELPPSETYSHLKTSLVNITLPVSLITVDCIEVPLWCSHLSPSRSWIRKLLLSLNIENLASQMKLLNLIWLSDRSKVTTFLLITLFYFCRNSSKSTVRFVAIEIWHTRRTGRPRQTNWSRRTSFATELLICAAVKLPISSSVRLASQSSLPPKTASMNRNSMITWRLPSRFVRRCSNAFRLWRPSASKNAPMRSLAVKTPSSRHRMTPCARKTPNSTTTAQPLKERSNWLTSAALLSRKCSRSRSMLNFGN